MSVVISMMADLSSMAGGSIWDLLGCFLPGRVARLLAA
jgi:hypothetical protein